MGKFIYCHTSASDKSKYQFVVNSPNGTSPNDAIRQSSPPTNIKFNIYKVESACVKDHPEQESGTLAFNRCPLSSLYSTSVQIYQKRKMLVDELYCAQVEELEAAKKIDALQDALDFKIAQWLIADKDVSQLKAAQASLKESYVKTLGRSDNFFNMAFILDKCTYDPDLKA